MRLCPTCRCPISVLATRCRHCGESVGRPRKEEHKLTIHDLGGETHTNYVISGNVMDALEAFRAEELSAQEVAKLEKGKSATWFGRKDTPTPEKLQPSDLPELDQEHRELSDLGAPSRAQTSNTQAQRLKSVQQRHQQPVSRTIFAIAAIGAGLVLLYLGTDYTWARINDYLEAKRNSGKVDYTTKAPQMLARGEDIVDVYDEAVNALRTTDKEENQAALEQVRTELIQRAEKVLTAPRLDRNAMDELSRWLSKASNLDTDKRIQGLAQKIRHDLFAYNMVLAEIDTTASPRTATFVLNNPEATATSETVQEGALLQGRFVVTNIRDTMVQLEDKEVATAAGGLRKLIARKRTLISSE